MKELTPEQKFKRAKDLQAFPVNVYEGRWNDGMTLRDYFASKAMQAIISSTVTKSPSLGFVQSTYNIADSSLIARISYEIADVMLKARDTE